MFLGSHIHQGISWCRLIVWQCHHPAWQYLVMARWCLRHLTSLLHSRPNCCHHYLQLLWLRTTAPDTSRSKFWFINVVPRYSIKKNNFNQKYLQIFSLPFKWGWRYHKEWVWQLKVDAFILLPHPKLFIIVRFGFWNKILNWRRSWSFFNKQG